MMRNNISTYKGALVINGNMFKQQSKCCNEENLESLRKDDDYFQCNKCGSFYKVDKLDGD